jgi:hypothetical protein
VKYENNNSRTLRIAMIGVFAALYVVTGFVPISMFIGAPSFLALNIIIVPVIALLLAPFDALLTSLFGGLLSFYIIPSQAMFGPYSILLPVCGATFGSLVSHKGKTGYLSILFFLGASISAYLVVNYQFPYFVVPHLIAAVLCGLMLVTGKTSVKIKILILAFITTMSEQGMMMILAVHLLGLPWPVFIGILPMMLYERLVATIGGALVIFGLMKALPNHFKG